MSEEEKKALEYFKSLNNLFFEPYLSILLKLVNKQQKEIDRLKKDKEILYEVIDEVKGEII